MKRSTIRITGGQLIAILVSGLLFVSHGSFAQLPPSIEADRLLVQAEREIGEGDYSQAVKTLDRILRLNEEQEIKIPTAFWFKRAQVSLEAGLNRQAIDSAGRYLEITGRDGEHYMAALQLLDKAELAAKTPKPLCQEVAVGTRCWEKLTNFSRCYVFAKRVEGEEEELHKATWTGDCSDGLSQGFGILTFQANDGAETKYVGRIMKGMRQGDWKITTSKGDVAEGPYVDGVMEGSWTEKMRTGEFHEGPMVGGRRHGLWKETKRNGDFALGPYVEGKSNGVWNATRKSDGTRWTVRMVNGEQQGKWKRR